MLVSLSDGSHSKLQLDVCHLHLNWWRRHLVNAYEVKGRYGVYCR